MKISACKRRRGVAFTLLELLIVLAVVAILATMLFPVYAGVRKRAQRVQCVGNLHSLYVAADLFLQRNGSWPQISRATSDTGEADFANAWIAALSPFGPTRETWICQSIQEIRQNPPYLKPEDARLDYIPMNFDDKPTSPHQWPRQPWFIESADAHGHGNLIIFTDGNIGESGDLLSELNTWGDVRSFDSRKTHSEWKL